MIKQLLDKLYASHHKDSLIRLYSSFLRHEAHIGGGLFGESTSGQQHEFFCLDQYTWIWHEEWIDANDKLQHRTTRYDIRPSGILKAQDGQSYQRVSMNEAFRLRDAARLYQYRVNVEMYDRLTKNVEESHNKISP